MRVLQVIHDFLPRHAAGSEIYTFLLSQELARRGHEVHLLYTEVFVNELQYTLHHGSYEGIPFTEVVHNHVFTAFDETYRDPKMDAIFRATLESFRPDVVHVQQLQYHSIDYLEIAHAAGIPILYTLHEYCLACPRYGLMMRNDGRLCAAADEVQCGDCLEHDPMHLPIQPHLRVKTDRVVKRWVPERLRRMVRKRLVKYGFMRPANGGPPPASRRDFRGEIRERLRVVRDRVRRVDLFVAQSPFLRTKLIEFGLPADRVVFSDYGFRAERFANLRRKPADRVRIAFIGTPVPYKGVHVLVEAFGLLPKAVRAKAELHVFGSLDVDPKYAERLRGLAATSGARLEGRFANEAIGEILSEVDVLVVPSLWYENSPLTIHEAFLADVPVVATRLGGMADLVKDGVNGLLFERGSAADLARALERCVTEPGLRTRLAAGIGRVKTMEEDAAWTEERYEALVASRRGAKRR
ncbi:MAG: glycosyltransferase [Planctomycetes bacterium]|nr:glycosyltransferase [Planctomycetota bacterium]